MILRPDRRMTSALLSEQVEEVRRGVSFPVDSPMEHRSLGTVQVTKGRDREMREGTSRTICVNRYGLG